MIKTVTFNQYDIMALSEKEWTNDINKHVTKYNQLKDIEVIDTKEIDNLLNNNYNFWFTMVNDNPYFNNDCYLVELTLSYINKPITIYINKEYLNMITGQETIEEVEQTQVTESIETIVNETYYTVGNTSFNTRYEAEEYCNTNDYEYTLIKEIGSDNTIIKPLQVKPVYWYEYKLRGFSIGCQPKGFIQHDPTIGKYGIISYDRPLTDNELFEYDLKPHHALFIAV